MTLHGDRQRVEAEIDSLLRQANGIDQELQSGLARYLCVLGSSYLEAAFREMVSRFCQQRAHPSVCRYVDEGLSYFRDPNIEKILQLLGRLDPAHRDRLQREITEKLKASVDSISANRNNIAHGRRSGISFAQVRGYLEDAKTVVAKARAVLRN